MAQFDLRGGATFAAASQGLRARISASFLILPGVRGWLETLAVTLVFAALALSLGLAGEFLEPRRAPILAPPLVLRVLIVPGLLEELVFRVVLPPRFSWLVLVAYVLVHLLNAWLFFPAARPIFYNPVFRLIVAPAPSGRRRSFTASSSQGGCSFWEVRQLSASGQTVCQVNPCRLVAASVSEPSFWYFVTVGPGRRTITPCRFFCRW